MKYRGNISSIFPGNYEANSSKLLEWFLVTDAKCESWTNTNVCILSAHISKGLIKHW